MQTVGHAMQRANHKPAGSAIEATLPFVAYSGAVQMRSLNLVLHDVIALTTNRPPGTHTTPETDQGSTHCRAASDGTRGKAWLEHRFTVQTPGVPYAAVGDYVQVRYENCIPVTDDDVMLNGTLRTVFTRELRGSYGPPVDPSPDVYFRAEYTDYQAQERGGSHVLRLDGHVSGRMGASPSDVEVAAGSSIRIREPGRDDRYANWQGQYRNGALSHSYSLTAPGVDGLTVRTLQTVHTIKPFDPEQVPTEGMQQGVTASGYTVTLEYTPQGPALR